MAESIKLKDEVYINSSSISHKSISDNFAGRYKLDYLLNYARELPAGDASSAQYWQKIPAGLWAAWSGTTPGDSVKNKPFLYGYYLVFQASFTVEPLVIGFSVEGAKEIYSFGANWDGTARWNWTKIS